MKRVMTSMAALAIGAGAAHAGGVERSTQSVGILFEQGNYAEFNIGGFNPNVSGHYDGNNTNSGDMAKGYGTYSLGYKQQLNDRFAFALILDQPLGANVHYPAGSTPFALANYPIADSSAKISSNALTALLSYKMPNNVTVYGGLRSEQAKGKADLHTLTYTGAGTDPTNQADPANYTSAPYSLRTSTETDLGYVVGVAWEKPEIAARVSLTYNSKITHDFTSQETVNGTDASLIPGYDNSFKTVSPESVNLEFQTGIMKDTLLMGSVRWVHWTQFQIAPSAYESLNGPLVDYKDNTITYTLGVGRRFNEQWSGAVMFGYEKHQGGTVGNLGPTDGYKSVSFAASYQATDNIKITGGVRYVDIGDATTNGLNADFSGNDGWGAGLRVGVSF
ncbi:MULTISPECIES: outer membrane protein transport protein [Thioclava]|uniref:outer membrane protein transport protein n=1 Tax=Thioclava TaxID=285107 RepID=UPI000C6AD969|nr:MULTISPECIES: outer membrane protein transport protein [Thioclava]MAQ38016.1 hypothetical protein [Thioclava sp.]